MKKYFFISLLLLITSCNINKNKKELVLEILNSEFVSYSGDKFYYFSEEYQNNFVSKYNYKITNTSNNKYVFNLDIFSDFVNKNHEYYNTKDILAFVTEKNDSATVYSRFNFDKKNNYSEKYLDYTSKILGQRYSNAQKLIPFRIHNFTLNPGETKYFQNYVLLPFGDDYNPSNVKFDKNKKYFVKLNIWSDSTRVEEYYDDSELKTFKENGYKFYHGMITSINKVPLKQKAL